MATGAAIRRYAAFVPVDGYSRGFEIASLPTDSNAFFRIGTESMCMLIAEQVVDAGGKTRYASSEPNTAIDDFVTTIMALSPSDSRATPARQILQEHYETTKSSGATASEALKSTFNAASIFYLAVLLATVGSVWFTLFRMHLFKLLDGTAR